VELDALLAKAVDATLQEATNKIKSQLSTEMEGIMKRLEEYQASYKLQAAKLLKERPAHTSFHEETNTDDDQEVSR
jgi:hypothetical protein